MGKVLKLGLLPCLYFKYINCKAPRRAEWRQKCQHKKNSSDASFALSKSTINKTMQLNVSASKQATIELRIEMLSLMLH